VEVAPAVGGRIAALEVHGWDVLRRDGWTDREWGSFVMAPWVGRLRDGRVRWHGRDWTMPLTEPPHALHGTVLDVPWDVASVDAASITLVTSLGEAWPFEASIARRIELHADRLVDRLTVTAAEPMPVITGWHPWFRRRAVRLDGGAESAPVELAIRAGRRVVLDGHGLPTGDTAAPRAEPMDEVLLDVAGDPDVSWPGGPRLEVRAPEAAAWVVYAAHPDGVCVEPLTGLPDGLNGGLLGEPPVAAPGAPVVAEMAIRWRADAP
jgi:galactose mutarotase-like enzyme